MSAKEDVVKGLWSCTHAGNCTDCPFDIKGGTECDEASTCILNLIKAAYEVLKTQEPKTIVVDEKPKNGNWFGIWFGRCPNCKQMLVKKDHEHFCGYCGQAVKWYE